jgi:hypothetical protein
VKKAILDALSIADLTAMFDKVMGTGTVNPPKGAA